MLTTDEQEFEAHLPIPLYDILFAKRAFSLSLDLLTKSCSLLIQDPVSHNELKKKIVILFISKKISQIAKYILFCH